MKRFEFMAGRTLRLAATLVWGLGLIGLPAAQAGTWEDAQAAFADLDDGLGLQRLAQAAQEGDVRAMHAWALALRHGPQLFPERLRADPALAAHWFDQLARRCGHLRAPADGSAPDTANPACPGAQAMPSTDRVPGLSSRLGTRRP